MILLRKTSYIFGGDLFKKTKIYGEQIALHIFFVGIHLKRGGYRWKTASLYLVLFSFRIIFSPFNIGLTEELGLSVKVFGDIANHLSLREP